MSQQTQPGTPPDVPADTPCTHEVCVVEDGQYVCAEPKCDYREDLSPRASDCDEELEIVISEEDKPSHSSFKRTYHDEDNSDVEPPKQQRFSRAKLWHKEQLNPLRDESSPCKPLPPLSLESYLSQYAIPAEDQIRLCRSYATYLTALTAKVKKTHSRSGRK